MHLPSKVPRNTASLSSAHFTEHSHKLRHRGDTLFETDVAKSSARTGGDGVAERNETRRSGLRDRPGGLVKIDRVADRDGVTRFHGEFIHTAESDCTKLVRLDVEFRHADELALLDDIASRHIGSGSVVDRFAALNKTSRSGCAMISVSVTASV